MAVRGGFWEACKSEVAAYKLDRILLASAKCSSAHADRKHNGGHPYRRRLCCVCLLIAGAHLSLVLLPLGIAVSIGVKLSYRGYR